MPPEDPIPTFQGLLAAKSRRPARTRSAKPSATPQLAFDLKPAQPDYTPIVLTPEPKAPPSPRPPAVYTVRQLINEIRHVVEGAYTATVNVEGEISNCRPAASGHVYFTLKDGDAQLPVVLFRKQAQLLGFKPRDGLAVEARGRVALYETRGQVQLIAETLRPRGTGALQLAFEQLRDRLRREGLFDRPRRPLPPFPHCIGIVTSVHGAAIRDIIQVVRRRHARLNLLIFPAPMQGPQCAPQVAAGIRFFNRIHEAQQNQVPRLSPLRPGRRAAPSPGSPPQIPCVDLILLARGGGSLEDLAGFNDELLARTIAASLLPVITGIGHEIDHTIADFVADLRAPTPSAAAELVTAAQHRIEERVLSLERRVHRASEFHLLRARRRFERLSAVHVLARLRDSIGLRQQRLDDLRTRLTTALLATAARRHRLQTARLAALEARLRRHDPHLRLALAARRLAAARASFPRLAAQLIARRRARVTQAVVRLEALNPLAVLSRGYAIVYLEQNGSELEPAGSEQNVIILRDAAEAAPNQQIRARLAQGSVRATISETIPS